MDLREVKDLVSVHAALVENPRPPAETVGSGNYDQDTLSKVSASTDEIGETGMVNEDSSNEELASALVDVGLSAMPSSNSVVPTYILFPIS
ncbi:uncharacterized protein ARMOST_02249 [Armillaria ostoyae]|uniref:Uncharacterized protein n=1 Tax=Armillaria ostoyae TaxID=47428 RepID=A0A284QR72_ARMOS|nr:uncharacterized protein ARMOST_02249 [Armillaria ostoyae]